VGRNVARAVGLLVLGLFLAGAGAAQAQKPAARPDVARQVEALAQAQEEAQRRLAEMRETLTRLEQRLDETAGAAGRQREALGEAEVAAKEARGEITDLVRGLYVEVNGVKGEIAAARAASDGLAAQLESSRFSSGLLIAIVIAFQIGLILLAIRARR